MNELLPREFAEAKARMDARRATFRSMSSSASLLDERALEAARARMMMQPRNDQTINELPLLSALNTDLVPIWRNGETAQVPLSSVVALTPVVNTQTNLTVFNVKAYGAVGDGLNDDTLGIQAAINATAGKGGIIYLPPGNYRISAALIVGLPNLIIMGAGASTLGLSNSGTVITQATSNSDIFTTGTVVTGPGPAYSLAIRDLNLTYAGGLGSAIGGAAIRLAYTQVAWIERVYISTCYDGIVFGADTLSPPTNPVVCLWVWVKDCVIAGVVDAAFTISGKNEILNISDNLCFGYGGNAGSSIVMKMTPLSYCDVMYFDRNDCENFGNGMLLINTTAVAGLSGYGIADSYIDSNIFDSPGSGPCLDIAATNLGAHGRIKCTSNWFTSSGVVNAVQIVATGTGAVNDVTFRGNFFSSSGAWGLSISGSGIPTDIEVSDNQFYGCDNASGGACTLVNGARIHLRDNMMAIRAGVPNNFGGIAIAAAVTDYVIEGNDVRHCASFGISNLAPTHGLARNNPGYNPIGIAASQPAVPVTTGTQGNPYPTDAMVYISATSTTGLTIVVSGYGGGSSNIVIPTNTSIGVRIPYGGLITLTYTGTAPTWVWAVD